MVRPLRLTGILALPLLLLLAPSCRSPSSEGADAGTPAPLAPSLAPLAAAIPDAAPPVDPAHLAERRKLAAAAASMPRPALAGVTTPAITAALHDPERAWALLTAPTTPYLERRALAYQWKSSFQLDYLPRLTRALTQLRPEAAAHGWGLDPHPDALADTPADAPADAPAAPRASGRAASTADGSRVTSVFGVPWTARTLHRDYPLTWEEEAAAPWPWQAHHTLEELFTSLFPRATGSSQLAAERAWLAACAALPWASDDDASMLVEASLGARHLKTPRVMGVWHAVSVSSAHPRAAVLVSRSLGDAAYAWDAPESQPIAEVIAVDLMASSNRAAREHAAFGLRGLARRSRAARGAGDEASREAPQPSTAILAALVLSQDPAAGDPWKRLYVYGFSALEAMASPPFVPDRTIAPTGPAAAARAEELARWFVAHRARLEAESAARMKTLDPTRKGLEHEAFSASRRGR